MARRREDAEGMEERGRRLRSIREALGLTQYDIVPKLNEAAERFGLPPNYRYYTVSRAESGTISFEDAAVWLAIDPAHHSWEWFVFGDRPPKSAKHPPTRPIEDSAMPPAPRQKRKAGGQRG